MTALCNCERVNYPQLKYEEFKSRSLVDPASFTRKSFTGENECEETEKTRGKRIHLVKKVIARSADHMASFNVAVRDVWPRRTCNKVAFTIAREDFI